MKCVDFHLHKEPIASRDADCHRSSSAPLLGTRDMGREPVHSACRGAVGTLLVEGTEPSTANELESKWRKVFFGVRPASGRFRRGFGKCQQRQEWGRT